MQIILKAMIISKYVGKSGYSTITVVDMDNADKIKIAMKGDPDVKDQGRYIFDGNIGAQGQYGSHYFKGIIKVDPEFVKAEGGDK